MSEAREQAWRDYWLSRDPAHALGHRTTFDGGWDARGQYDQQRIAALVEEVAGMLANYQGPCSWCEEMEGHLTGCSIPAVAEALRALAWLDSGKEAESA